MVSTKKAIIVIVILVIILVALFLVALEAGWLDSISFGSGGGGGSGGSSTPRQGGQTTSANWGNIIILIIVMGSLGGLGKGITGTQRYQNWKAGKDEEGAKTPDKKKSKAEKEAEKKKKKAEKEAQQRLKKADEARKKQVKAEAKERKKAEQKRLPLEDINQKTKARFGDPGKVPLSKRDICPHCGNLIYKGTKKCPLCKKDPRKKAQKKTRDTASASQGASSFWTTCENCGKPLGKDMTICEVCHHAVGQKDSPKQPKGKGASPPVHSVSKYSESNKIKCHNCYKEISKYSEVCPHCNARQIPAELSDLHIPLEKKKFWPFGKTVEFGHALFDEDGKPIPNTPHGSTIICPKCHKSLMMFKVKPNHSVKAAVCPNCKFNALKDDKQLKGLFEKIKPCPYCKSHSLKHTVLILIKHQIPASAGTKEVDIGMYGIHRGRCFTAYSKQIGSRPALEITKKHLKDHSETDWYIPGKSAEAILSDDDYAGLPDHGGLADDGYSRETENQEASPESLTEQLRQKYKGRIKTIGSNESVRCPKCKTLGKILFITYGYNSLAGTYSAVGICDNCKEEQITVGTKIRKCIICGNKSLHYAKVAASFKGLTLVHNACYAKLKNKDDAQFEKPRKKREQKEAKKVPKTESTEKSGFFARLFGRGDKEADEDVGGADDMAGMVKCSKCEAIMPKDADICFECGADFTEDDE
ncbi:MAG: hypothetical protein ABIG20_01030 [archaeon]